MSTAPTGASPSPSPSCWTSWPPSLSVSQAGSARSSRSSCRRVNDAPSPPTPSSATPVAPTRRRRGVAGQPGRRRETGTHDGSPRPDRHGDGQRSGAGRGHRLTAARARLTAQRARARPPRAPTERGGPQRPDLVAAAGPRRGHSLAQVRPRPSPSSQPAGTRLSTLVWLVRVDLYKPQGTQCSRARSRRPRRPGSASRPRAHRRRGAVRRRGRPCHPGRVRDLPARGLPAPARASGGRVRHRET